MQGAEFRPTMPCFFSAVRQVARTWLEAMKSLEQLTTSTSWRGGGDSGSWGKINTDHPKHRDHSPLTCWSRQPRPPRGSTPCSGWLLSRRPRSAAPSRPVPQQPEVWAFTHPQVALLCSASYPQGPDVDQASHPPGDQGQTVGAEGQRSHWGDVALQLEDAQRSVWRGLGRLETSDGSFSKAASLGRVSTSPTG